MARSAAEPFKEYVNYCLRLLSISPRTENELSLRLKAKGCRGEEAGRIIEFLKKERLIDDLAFAKEWIASRMRTAPRGREMLEHELRKKGVRQETITKAFSELPCEFDEKELAERLARKKMQESSMRKGGARAKLCRYLAGKGFGEGVVEDVVRRLLGDENLSGNE